MSQEIPIPATVFALLEERKARERVDTLKIENTLLKHLVETLDPDHDYVLNLSQMKLLKVRRDEDGSKDDVPDGNSQDASFGDQENPH